MSQPLVADKANTLTLPVLDRVIWRMAFGCEPLGGFNWGDVDIAAIEAAIETALDHANDDVAILFDTADTYGPYLSEERLGSSLKGRRRAAVLATKFGVRLNDGRVWYDTSPNYADRALDASLTRLGTDHIDLYQLHWPDGTTPLADTLAALEQFRQDGRIGAYGVTNIAPKILQPFLSDFPGLISFSSQFSLLDREGEADILSLMQTKPTVYFAYGCLAQGLLSGKYDANTVFATGDRRASAKYWNFHGNRLVRNLKIIDTLKTQAAALGCSMPALSLAFVIARLPQAIPLVGIKKPAQFHDNFASLAVNLPKTTLNQLIEAST